MRRQVVRIVHAVCAAWPLCRAACWYGSRDKRHVALTFDDGPDASITESVLERLSDAGVKATFFVLGQQVDRHPELVARIVSEGHEIGLHGYDHSSRDVPRQVQASVRALSGHGLSACLYRPPRGQIGLSDFLWLILHRFSVIFWSADWHDSMRAEGKWTGPAPRPEDVRRGDIVLMHDDNAVCLEELPALLNSLRERGLVPVTVSELIGRK